MATKAQKARIRAFQTNRKVRLGRPVVKQRGVPKWAILSGVAAVIGGAVFFILKR